jgi:hypothetical protein
MRFSAFTRLCGKVKFDIEIFIATGYVINLQQSIIYEQSQQPSVWRRQTETAAGRTSGDPYVRTPLASKPCHIPDAQMALVRGSIFYQKHAAVIHAGSFVTGGTCYDSEICRLAASDGTALNVTRL